jgi:hypothetical protein
MASFKVLFQYLIRETEDYHESISMKLAHLQPEYELEASQIGIRHVTTKHTFKLIITQIICHVILVHSVF